MDVEFERKTETPFNIIDVRAPEDYAEGHIPGALNLPEDKWTTLSGLAKEKLNVVYCYNQTCHLAGRAALFFAEMGYPVSEMEGGFEDWKNHNLEIEKGEAKVDQATTQKKTEAA
jgi:rhodanese-related sulfurtransferase